MKKRNWPRHWDSFFELANRENLSFPRGRALYACNRIQNGSGGYSLLVFSYEQGDKDAGKEIIKLLKKIRVTTADRWYQHWLSGGSVKSLSYGSAGRSR